MCSAMNDSGPAVAVLQAPFVPSPASHLHIPPQLFQAWLSLYTAAANRTQKEARSGGWRGTSGGAGGRLAGAGVFSLTREWLHDVGGRPL